MGTRTGQSVLDRAWIKAHDNDINKRWDADEGLIWVNDAQLAVVELLPRAYTQSTTVTAAPGTRQTMVTLGITRGLQFIDVPHNVSLGGAPGSPITKVKRAFMDERVPTWHSALATEAKHWMTDEEDPKACYITPAISGGGKLKVVYAAMPEDLTSLESTLVLDDIYANACQWFVLFSFYSKDLASIKSSQMAQMYYGLFQQSLGIRDQKISMTEGKSNANQKGT